ncbi:hypothetical protein [Halogeometricum borinquense]|uniref:hypothetical protein n=1 Tax=Halogeometricum borinquense TaxID=60847 RepID=UPI001EF90F3E|nr:hypothetical protein [Halogeometricum borinquense]
MIDAYGDVDPHDVQLDVLARQLAGTVLGAAGIPEDFERVASEHGVSAVADTIADPSDWIEAVSGVHVQ